MNINLPGVFQQGDDILVFADGRTETFNRNTFPKWEELKAAIDDADWQSIPELITSAKNALCNFLAADGTTVKFVDNTILLNGTPLPNALLNILLRMWHDSCDMQPYVELIARLDKTPSQRVFEETLTWIDKQDLSITPEGTLWAYRAVTTWDGDDFTDAMGRTVTKGDFVDKYTAGHRARGDFSQSFRNNVGDVVRMKRRLVDENRNNECSNGLHFATLGYAQNSYGTRNDVLLLVEVDPADIVSIPRDYNGSKGRTCCYTVRKVWRNPNTEKVAAIDTPVMSLTDLDSYLSENRWQVLERETNKVLASFRTRAEAYESIANYRLMNYDVKLFDTKKAS